METPRICVVHSSDRIRETVTILLEGRWQIASCSPAAVVREPALCADADLVVAQADAPRQAIRSLPAKGRILWLLGPGGGAPAAISARTASLPASFTPGDLIAKVEELLATPAPEGPDAPLLIDYPLVPEAAARLIHSAQKLDLPVLICGEPGSGKSRVAQAIHSAHPERAFRVLAAGSPAAAVLREIATASAGETTLCVRDLLAAGADDVVALCDLLDRGGLSSTRGWHSVRLICFASLPYERLAADRRLAPDLFYRLGALTITLPPLRERSADIPALAEVIADRLSSALGRPAVRFSAAALTRLQRYLWFGNLAELETVLARSIALAGDTPLDTRDLLFGYGDVPVAALDTTPARSAESEASRAADLIINELAHELKNPLVAIKTVTQQLDHFTRDPATRQEAAKLAGDAVERMDHTIENLVRFSQFGAPSRTDVALNALLGPAMAAVKGTTSERRIDFDFRATAPQIVHVDAAQIEYALENLLRAIIRDVDDGRTISIRSSGDDGTIEIEFQKGGLKLSERLASMMGHAANGNAAAEPLGFVFAKSLVERNAGQVAVSSSGSTRVVTVHLPLERNSSCR